MFENLWFWTSWPKKEKILLLALLSILAIAGFYLVITYLSGGAFVLDWIEQSTSNPIRILYDQFNAGLYRFSIFADNYVIVKTFHSSNIQVNVTAARIFLAIFFLSLLFLLALASSVSRFYFLLFCAFFIVILVSMKLENILLFGWYDKETLFLLLAVFLLPAYYLHAFKSHVQFVVRFLILLSIAILMALVIYFFAEVEKPFFYLASYGIVSPIIMSIIFILMIGFEVLRGLLTVVTQNTLGGGKTNFIHFSILSIIYIAILVLIFLYNENYITWKVVGIDAVWILLAASAIGFWGFKGKEDTYSHIFKFKPLGAYLYLLLALICFSTYAYSFASANDPLTEVLEDAVIFSQLSFSIIFFVYILANFFPAMMEGLQVHKIIYKPKFMPYISAIIAALIGVLAFFFLSNKAAYYQMFSGYYISLANLHLLQKDDIIAKDYYELSNIYGRQTHFGNFALAKMADKAGETGDAENYLARSLNRNPTAFAFADLAGIYEERSNFFDALFILKHGVNHFPDSGPLAVNLGKLLSKTNILDSAAYYYLKGAERRNSEVAGLTNIYSLYALADLKMEKDSLKLLIPHIEPFPAENNLMVLAAQKGYNDLIFNHQISFNEGISIDQLIYNFNAILYHPKAMDSVDWKAFRGFYDRVNSALFQDELEYAFALAFAKNNNTIAATRILNVLNREDSYGYRKYDLLMAQYFMKFGAPLLALDYYENTFRYYEGNVLTEMGLALMEAGKLDDARSFWQNIIERNDSIAGDVAREMLTLVSFDNFRDVVNKGDHVKYNFLRYRHKELSLDEHEGIILSIENQNLQIAAYIELLEKFIKKGKYEEAARIVDKIPLNHIKEEHLLDQLLKQLVIFSVKIEDMASLENLLPQLQNRETIKPYYLLAEAFHLELSGHYDKARQLYEELSVMDAFCEECILQSARYLENNGQQNMTAYNILVEAIDVNKYSIPLNKAYVQKAIELGLTSYVSDVLGKMEDALHEDEFAEFKSYVEETRNENTDAW